MPGTPMPPSLKLPDPVTDLSAVRTGNHVTLTWTMPKKNTDKLPLKANIPVRLCRKEGSAPCEPVAKNLSLAPGADGEFTETLPPALAAGPPRPFTYFVDLTNTHGRSAGPSNPAIILAGEAPPPVSGLSAEVRKAGVVLSWTAVPQDAALNAIRLHRKVLRREAETKSKNQPGLLAAPPDPVEQNLLVEPGERSWQAKAGRAEDRNILFSRVYEYRAQRVVRVSVDGQALELAGEWSAPVQVETLDIFPPAAPTDLAAVAATGGNGATHSIDLNWRPVADPDLAGYALYRLDGNGQWQRISPPEPFLPPAFRDTDVQAGHSYRYAVTAVGKNGHESARSAETQETVPNP